MTSFHRFRRVLMTIGLVSLLLTVITFSFGSEKSWATTLFTTSINQPYISAVTLNQAKVIAKNEAKNAEGKAQEELGKMTGDLKDQATGKAKQFEANTQKAIIDSIENPNYQPNGRNLRKKSQTAVECLENDVRDCFDQSNTKT